MNWPQITWLVLAALGLGIHLALHGRARTGQVSVWPPALGTAVTAWLLYSGGFFSQA